ncbi:hypothetical protein [Streptomyces sp. NPDC018036]|uniref:hypothetical protein n=1 Tax=Streptomyces sp. NPDC018036 TaxID=3365035 RepID=UPI00379A61D1
MDDWHIKNAIQGYSGDENLKADMDRQLHSEQMEYYKRANTPEFEGFGGWQGFKEFLTGCAMLLVLGLIFKYVLHIG